MDEYRHFYQKYENLAPFESPFSFRKNATIGCGGEAKVAFYPRTLDEAIALLQALEADGRQYVVLGALSNVLPSDGISEKIVVSTKRLSGVSFDEGVFVLAGTTTGALLTACQEKGLTGAEFLVGIPCTIGGAAYMNAGAQGVYLDTIVQKTLVYQDGEVKEYSKEDCGYAYKHSVFMHNGGVILGVWLALAPASAEEIRRKKEYFKEKRKDLPKGRSMGCVFKNPDGDFAGRLIEGAGLKGKRIGGAYVSFAHANFILTDDATAQDVRDLIGVIKERVFARFGVKLEEEIKYL